MSSTKKTNPQRTDDDNPELTREDMATARPATELLAEHLGEKATQEIVRRGKGRPPVEQRKVNQTLRIDPEVLDAYRQQGKGWQTRINDVLRKHMPKEK